MSRFINSVAERIATATAAFSTRAKAPHGQETSGGHSKLALLLTAGILSSVALTASAATLTPAQNGTCGVAVLDGRHVQPSAECRLPPPVAQNSTSIGNTPQPVRDELEQMAEQLFGETERFAARSGTPSLGDRTSLQPIAAKLSGSDLPGLADEMTGSSANHLMPSQ